VTNVVNINDRNFVRFFAEPVGCDNCGEDTRGYVYEDSQQIICSHCRGVLLELERERVTTEMVIIFKPEDDDE
jgi:hypothetical protein